MGPEAGVRSGALALIYRTFLKPSRFLGFAGDAIEEHESLKEYTGSRMLELRLWAESATHNVRDTTLRCSAGVLFEALVLFYCISRKPKKREGFRKVR